MSCRGILFMFILVKDTVDRYSVRASEGHGTNGVDPPLPMSSSFKNYLSLVCLMDRVKDRVRPWTIWLVRT